MQWQWHPSWPHNLYCLQNLLADSLLCVLRTRFLFYSFTFIFYLYFDFFILTLLICEGFWTRRLTIHNMIWEGHWFTMDHCWLRKWCSQCYLHMDIHTPLITKGWIDLISFYADKSDKLVLFKYVRNSSFQLHVSNRSTNSLLRANFLNHICIRRPLSMSNLIHFQVQLFRYYCKASHLVSFFFLFNYFFTFLLYK